jgi:hypothetical protein
LREHHRSDEAERVACGVPGDARGALVGAAVAVGHAVDGLGLGRAAVGASEHAVTVGVFVRAPAAVRVGRRADGLSGALVAVVGDAVGVGVDRR